MIETKTIGVTISHALRPGLPPYDELVALERTLLIRISELYAAVDEAERQNPVAGRRARLTSVCYQDGVGLGAGLLSAQMQVRALARDCQWLLEQHPVGSR